MRVPPFLKVHKILNPQTYWRFSDQKCSETEYIDFFHWASALKSFEIGQEFSGMGCLMIF